MKKAFAITLIITFLFNLAGCFVILHIQHYRLHGQMLRDIKNGMPSSRVSQIRINKNSKRTLKWEGAGEFRYKGIWYDVVKMEKRPDGSIIYHCIADQADTNLFSEMADLLRKKDKDMDTGKFPVKNYRVLAFHPSTSFIAMVQPFGLVQTHGFMYSRIYSAPRLDIASPPPQIS